MSRDPVARRHEIRRIDIMAQPVDERGVHQWPRCELATCVSIDKRFGEAPGTALYVVKPEGDPREYAMCAACAQPFRDDLLYAECMEFFKQAPEPLPEGAPLFRGVK